MGRAHEVRAKSMAATAAAKSKLYAKYSKEILIAAKSGTPDPNENLTLRRAIEKAKWVLRNCILNMNSEDDVLCYERICKEIDEEGYSMEIEINIFVDRVDMED